MTIPTAIIQVTRKTLELGAFQLTATGLVIRGAPSFDEWQRCGGVLQRVEGACQWWIGDWVNWRGTEGVGREIHRGRRRFGDSQGVIEDLCACGAEVPIV